MPQKHDCYEQGWLDKTHLEDIDTTMRFPFYPIYQIQPSLAEMSILVFLLLFLKL